MTVTASVLIPSKTAENTAATQYTSQGVTTIIDKFTAINYSAAAAAITVYLVANGGSPSSDNIITKTKTLQANEFYTFPEITGHVLANGSYISTTASVATAISIRASGRIIS